MANIDIASAAPACFSIFIEKKIGILSLLRPETVWILGTLNLERAVDSYKEYPLLWHFLLLSNSNDVRKP